MISKHLKGRFEGTCPPVHFFHTVLVGWNRRVIIECFYRRGLATLLLCWCSKPRWNTTDKILLMMTCPPGSLGREWTRGRRRRRQSAKVSPHNIDLSPLSNCVAVSSKYCKDILFRWHEWTVHIVTYYWWTEYSWPNWPLGHHDIRNW